MRHTKFSLIILFYLASLTVGAVALSSLLWRQGEIVALAILWIDVPIAWLFGLIMIALHKPMGS